MRGQPSGAPRGAPRGRGPRRPRYPSPPPDPVLKAVSEGDLATLRALIAAGHDVTCRRGNMENPLMIAVEKNSLEAVRMLVEAGADPCDVLADGISDYTPMSVAAARGGLEMFRLIWAAVPSEKRAQHERRRYFESCLVQAACYGYTSLLEYLLDGWLNSPYATWSVENVDGALYAAAAAYELPAATLLLDRVIYTPEALRTALFELLETKCQDPASPYPPLLIAVDSINQELLARRLIDAGQLDPDLYKDGEPLIHHAVWALDRIGVLRAVLEKGRLSPPSPAVFPPKEVKLAHRELSLYRLGCLITSCNRC